MNCIWSLSVATRLAKFAFESLVVGFVSKSSLELFVVRNFYFVPYLGLSGDGYGEFVFESLFKLEMLNFSLRISFIILGGI